MKGRRCETDLRLAIVGLGSRGLTIFERIVSLARSRPELNVEVAILEPNEPGIGIHSPTQPDYLKLNTVACQITMFPGLLSEERGGSHFGPNLYEWCQSRGDLVPDDHAPDVPPRPVQPMDFLPRRVLGEYLSWFFGHLIRQAPSNLTLSLHRTMAEDIHRRAQDGRFALVAENGACILADSIFITTGHAIESSGYAPGGIRRPAYPLPGTLRDIRTGETVEIHGLGLTAMDVMVALVHEWGGCFQRDGQGSLRYRRSGREGRLVFVSRNGMPFRARPQTRVSRPRHQAAFLTAEAIDGLRRAAGTEGLDFEADILPLMRLEMTAAYYAACAARGGNEADPDDIGPLLGDAKRRGGLDDALARLASRFGAFDPDDHLLLRLPAGLGGDGYRRWFLDQLRADLAASRKGLDESPLKAALEVWRDLRDALRAVVDGRALTPASRRRFFCTYAPMINRLVAGPQWERIAEFQCLIEDGVAEVALQAAVADPFGAMGRTQADANGDRARVIRAHVPMSGTTRRDAPLLWNLARKGIVSSMLAEADVDGVAVTPEGRAIAPDGTVSDGIWVFGPPVEGATYYNHYVPSPGGFSRAYNDAHQAVKTCFDHVPTKERRLVG
ncbi:FAD/NAD(P)-binding protein [Arenibaculum sp.]|jgi:hypothetical protein|uniref:FAD/NAD(P)-binding protein n=1 Tax=Arenibaculum sp. TaxID=2865862 RepID=UPI002E12765C|nr:FAD/NAD(P)-binding protein [Arenibaculum sp.]